MLSAKKTFSFRSLRTKRHDCPPAPSAAAEPATSKPPTLEQLAGIAWEGNDHDGSSSDNSNSSNNNGNVNNNSISNDNGKGKRNDESATTAELGTSQHSLHSSKEKKKNKRSKKKKKHVKKERTVDQDTNNRQENSGGGGGDDDGAEEEAKTRRRRKKEKRKKKREGLDSPPPTDISDITSPSQEKIQRPSSLSRSSSRQQRPPRCAAPPQRSSSLPVSAAENRDPSALLKQLLTQKSSSTRRLPQLSSEHSKQWQQQAQQQDSPRAERRWSHLNAAPRSFNHSLPSDLDFTTPWSSFNHLSPSLTPSSDHGPEAVQPRQQQEHARRRSYGDVDMLVDDLDEPITPPQARPQLQGRRGKRPPLPEKIAHVNPFPAMSSGSGEASFPRPGHESRTDPLPAERPQPLVNELLGRLDRGRSFQRVFSDIIDNSSSNDEDSVNSNRTESGDEGEWEEAISAEAALRSKAAAGNLISIPCIPCSSSSKSDPPEEGGGGEETSGNAPAESFGYFNMPSAGRNDPDNLLFKYSTSDASFQSMATPDASDEEGGDGNDKRVLRSNAAQRPRNTVEQLQQQIGMMHVQFQKLRSAKVYAELRAQQLETDLAAIQKERDAALTLLREEKDDAEMKAHKLETDLVSLREERDAEFVRLSEETERWRRAAQEEEVRRDRERWGKNVLEENVKALKGENQRLKLLLEQKSRNAPAQSGKEKGVMVTRLEESFSLSCDECSLPNSFLSSRTAATMVTPKVDSPTRGHKHRRHTPDAPPSAPGRPSDTPPRRSSSDPIEWDAAPDGQAPTRPSSNQMRGRASSRDSARPSSKSGMPQAPASWHGGKTQTPSAIRRMPTGVVPLPLTGGGGPEGRRATAVSSPLRRSKVGSLLRRKNSASTASTVRSSVGSLFQDSYASLGDFGLGLSVESLDGVVVSMEDHANSVLMEEADNCGD